MNMHEECLKRQNEGYHTPLPELIERIERDSQKLKQRFAPLDIEDAIYYLKEYQEKREEICKIAKIIADSWELRKQTMAFEDRNDPISWDELKEMEGKPVWIEDPGRKEWMIIDHVVDEDTKYERLYIQSFYPRSFYKHDHQWKAYRKERS